MGGRGVVRDWARLIDGLLLGEEGNRNMGYFQIGCLGPWFWASFLLFGRLISVAHYISYVNISISVVETGRGRVNTHSLA